jgi:FkbM family methyltransferase
MLGRMAALVQASRLAGGIRRQIRRRGWELRRSDPDRSLAEHLWFLFPHLGTTCVLDVGAGTGEYGNFLRRNGYAGNIVSFEPYPVSFQQLVQQASADPRWRVYPYALGATTGPAELHVTRDIRYASVLSPTEHALRTFPASTVERTVAVDIRRLEDVLDELLAPLIDPVVFLKISPQGSERDVLLGAGRRLESLAGLQVELSLDPLYQGAAPLPEALTALMAAGFAVSGLFDRPHHHDFRLAEVDCVMVRVSTNESHVRRRW